MDITPEQAKKITRNIERAGEFLRYLIENPSEFEKIPNGSNIRFVDCENSNEEKFAIEGNVINVRKVYEFA